MHPKRLYVGKHLKLLDIIMEDHSISYLKSRYSYTKNESQAR